MKKLLLALAVMAAFFTIAFGIAAQDWGPGDIRTTLGKPDLNIIDTGSITFLDSGNNVIENPDINSKVKVRFDWSLANEDAMQIEAGQTFTFTLPDTFRIPSNMNVTLGDYGTAAIGTNRTVVITFSDQVALNSEVHGYLEFEARLNSLVLTEPGPKVVLLPVRENATVNFNLVPTNRDTSVEKDGNFDRALNPAAITWEVTINKAYDALSGVVVTDAMPAGLTLGSIEVYPVNLDLNGNFVSYGAKLPAGDYTVSGTQVTLGDISQPYAIRYLTTINDAVKPDDGGDLPFKNQVVMSSTGNPNLPAEATLVASYGKLLNKTVSAYDNLTQTFTWTVEYNFGEKTLVNPLLQDSFDPNMAYVDGSISITDLNGAPLSLAYTLTKPSDGHLDLQFNQTISQPIRISYATRVADGFLITENRDFTNTVATAGKTSGATGTATPQMIVKSSPSINYQTRQIAWAIDINRNGYYMDNYSLTDTYPYMGLAYVPGTFTVWDVTENHVIAPADYNLNFTTSPAGETGFTLAFTGAYAETHSRILVAFTTAYDFNALTNGATAFRNTAVLNWTDQYDVVHQHSSTADRPVNLETRINGKKAGSYNAVSKEITWTVNANYNDEAYVNPVITDVINTGQHFVPGSLEVRSYTVNPDGSTTEGGVVNTSSWTIQLPEIANGQTLRIELPSTPGIKYQVRYRTSLAGEMVGTTYQNRAVFTNGSYTRNLDASVSVNNGNRLVTKSGAQNGSQINWAIAINQSQSTIVDALLQDQPSGNQILVEDSFRLYPVLVNADESYTVDRDHPLVRNSDYTLTISTDADGKQSFELHFLNVITRTYVLEYTSEISAAPNDTTVTNSVTMNGNQVTYQDGNGSTTVVIDVASAGGGAVGVKGSLTIRKVDEQGNPLQGVRFDLYNPLNRKINSSLTAADGTISFRNLVYGNYTLKEVQTLDGFVIGDELFAGTRVTIGAASSRPGAVTVFTNVKNKLVIDKINENSTLLDGSVFTLEQKSGNDYVVHTQGLTLQGGSATLEGLPAGDYRLVETQAPAGYLLNTQPLDFTIGVNANQQAQDVHVRFTDYKGSVELLKTDGSRQPLAGAVFSLYDGNGGLLQSGLQTGTDGRLVIADLAPGSYSLVETASAGGNIANTTPIPFTILSENAGKPDAVQLGWVNAKGAVEFIKKDEGGQTLSGVGFDLFQIVDGREIKVGEAVSGADGKVTVGSLSPGSYRFRETTPKAGYLRNTTPIDFTIPASTTAWTYVLTLGDYINYKGGIVLQKYDGHQHVLAGALFDVYDSQQQRVRQDLATGADGKLSVDGLAPGNYTFVETASADGNIANVTPIPFIILSEYAGKPPANQVDWINVKGSVHFIKANEGGQPLSGVPFTLFKVVNGVEVPVGVLLSDSHGNVQRSELEPGTYRIREAAPKRDYLLNTTPIEFVIPATTTDRVVSVDAGTFVNYQGSVELIKLDGDHNPLPGALFNLVDRENHVLQRNLRTDANGKITVANLAPGRYALVEVKSAGGNILNDTPIPFTIPFLAAGKPALVQVTGTNSKGSVEFKKVDEGGQPLGGAVFGLFRIVDGREVQVATVTSDTDGMVTYGNLEPGSYRFREITAPKGYLVNSSVIDFAIPERSRLETVVITLPDFLDDQGSVVLRKVDTKGSLIGEAEFNLVDEKTGAVLGSYGTNGGVLEISKLAPGSYALVETQAPAGYLLNGDPVSFEIPVSFQGSFEAVSLVKENRREGSLPKTGEDLLMAAGALALVAGGFVVLRASLKKQGR